MPAPDSPNPFIEIMNVAGKVDPGALVTLWANLPPHPPGFTGDLFERFDEIDRDGDGFISRAEVDAACSDPVFKGRYAAALATLRKALHERDDRHELEELSDDEIGWENDGVTRADLAGFDLVTNARPDEEFVERVNIYYHNAKVRIEEAPRRIFRDPEHPTVDPLRCRQGLIGDCFFLAPLVALAHQDPGRLLAMIERHPERPGSWQVRFPRSERPISVAMPNDTEIALLSCADGLWSAVFEIAYGKQVYRDKNGRGTRFEPLDPDLVDKAIEVLTGAPANILWLELISMAELGARLEDAMANDKVVVAATKRRPSKDEAKEKGPSAYLTTDGLERGHDYSILGFGDNVALVRDPMGGSGEGPLGQELERGVFQLPLACFHTSFAKLAIER